jgi:hypothetical protein
MQINLQEIYQGTAPADPSIEKLLLLEENEGVYDPY